jgi:hypothetical protein
VIRQTISNLKSLTHLNLNLFRCRFEGCSVTDESVVSIGRMLGGLTSLTQLTLDMTDWECLSDRSVVPIFTSLTLLPNLSSVSLDLSVYNNTSSITSIGFADIHELIISKDYQI